MANGGEFPRTTPLRLQMRCKKCRRGQGSSRASPPHTFSLLSGHTSGFAFRGKGAESENLGWGWSPSSLSTSALSFPPSPTHSSLQHLILYMFKPLKISFPYFLLTSLLLFAGRSLQHNSHNKRSVLCALEQSDFLPAWFASVTPLLHGLNL